jgi:hypothetical protein
MTGAARVSQNDCFLDAYFNTLSFLNLGKVPEIVATLLPGQFQETRQVSREQATYYKYKLVTKKGDVCCGDVL